MLTSLTFPLSETAEKIKIYDQMILTVISILFEKSEKL